MNEILDNYENRVSEALFGVLREKRLVDERRMEMPDIEEKWKDICAAYLPDGMREYGGYPTVSLGWMMYVGMAVAHMWDDDWEKYSALENIYTHLRDVRGYDCMDEYISEEVLRIEGVINEQTARLVGDLAQAANSMLRHEPVEPGTAAAFHAYVRTLHQLYVAGAEVELYRLGYKMSRLQ